MVRGAVPVDVVGEVLSRAISVTLENEVHFVLAASDSYTTTTTTKKTSGKVREIEHTQLQ